MKYRPAYKSASVRFIPADTWRKFRLIAFKNGMTTQELMLAVIAQAVEYADLQEKAERARESAEPAAAETGT